MGFDQAFRDIILQRLQTDPETEKVAAQAAGEGMDFDRYVRTKLLKQATVQLSTNQLAYLYAYTYLYMHLKRVMNYAI